MTFDETTTSTSRETEDKNMTSTPYTKRIDDLTYIDCRDYKKRKVRYEVIEYNFKEATL